ncbi:putative ABC transporter permease YknZ [Dickeya dianthicola]|uniref:ABC transporter permease n=1 Tax=Dickeya dianthicola TaxID=204039 RepID=A0AAP2CWJ8_9GAMM|nr:ABC transporter permease [Dickeya dianthicola]ATO35622.1 ABC transporter permease protein [Dickeya dianthicola RNS04.9]AYC17060.1 putative ABC transporter permease YknZ [Dickeya dianthicola]MBI0437348.1 ABC transporter permease [Dickeya dianthicola]MBI0451272.1 ABC transporter permease [Dickeya dianthicola]MBI0453186.1 ABC transporter permease [Dickeya dianthicola]
MRERLSSGYGPSLRQRLTEPLESLRMLGRRAVLALLGIAVGCGAVVALINVGHNAEAQAMAVFRNMGSDLLVANIQFPAGSQPPRYVPDTLDTAALREALPDILAASALIMTSVESRLQGRRFNTMVVGVNPAFSLVLDLRIAQGRFLSQYDAHSTHAVLGARVVTELLAKGIPVTLGDRVQLGGYLFQVVGILQARGQNPMMAVSVDDSILVPIEGMRRIVPSPQINTLLARNRRSETLEQVAPQLQARLQALLPGRQIDVQIPQQLLAGIAQQSRLFSWLLAGLGGISLLVGGVGVMNVMLMNVAERRREIGVRMALGARPRDIASLFLLEAVALTAAGALVGAVGGIGAAWFFVTVSGWAGFTLSPFSLCLGVGSSVLAGLFFGLTPALSAARLQPVQALRDE